jgi:hypothetical protein
VTKLSYIRSSTSLSCSIGPCKDSSSRSLIFDVRNFSLVGIRSNLNIPQFGVTFCTGWPPACRSTYVAHPSTSAISGTFRSFNTTLPSARLRTGVQRKCKTNAKALAAVHLEAIDQLICITVTTTDSDSAGVPAQFLADSPYHYHHPHFSCSVQAQGCAHAFHTTKDTIKWRGGSREENRVLSGPSQAAPMKYAQAFKL